MTSQALGCRGQIRAELPNNKTTIPSGAVMSALRQRYQTPYHWGEHIERDNPMTNKYLRGEIYIIDFDPIRGSEQGGRRPAIILQNDIGNQHSPTVIVASITSQKKPPLPVHLPINGIPGLKKGSIVLLEQIRTVDKSRIYNYLGSVGAEMMRAIDTVLAVSLGIQCQRNEQNIMTLCHDCKMQFEDADFKVRLISNLNDPKDTCDFCNTRRGFDYEVVRA